jgi:hypothetical protein
MEEEETEEEKAEERRRKEKKAEESRRKQKKESVYQNQVVAHTETDILFSFFSSPRPPHHETVCSVSGDDVCVVVKGALKPR